MANKDKKKLKKTKVKKPKNNKTILLIISCILLVAMIVLAVVLVAIFNTPDTKPSAEEQSNSSLNSATQTETGKTSSSETQQPEPSNSSTQTQPQTSTKTPTATVDESNVPLCQRKYLSDSEVQDCAAQLQAQREAEIAGQLQEARERWCNENVPQIYDSHNARLLAENARYEREIENYVSSYMASSGAPASKESIAREIAEKQYGPLHEQLVNSIVSQYISAVQGHGCDLSKYSF